MKWTIVLVALLVTVRATELEQESIEQKEPLPILRIKQEEKDATIVPSPEKESSEDKSLSELSQPDIDVLGEDESSNNEVKRVKKSHGLTTICVEIKPSSPYEPPYFMCRGTDQESGGGYKPSSYGGKPSSGKGGSYAPAYGHGYEKPSHGGPYASHNEYAGPGYAKPKPDKYLPEAPAHGGYGTKPSYGGPAAGYGGMSGYGEKPIKYHIPPHGAYAGPKPSAPYGGGYGGYEAHGPAGYGKPQTQYGPHYDAHAPAKYGKPYGGDGYHAGPTFEVPHSGGYGVPSHGTHAGGSYGHGPAYKGGSKPGSGKVYSAPTGGGYRTIIIDDSDEDDEINEVEEVPVSPVVGSPTPYNYQPARPYAMPAPQAYAYSSPAPKVPCGTNLLVGCNPNVMPVPCYGSAPQAQPPTIVYNVPPPPMYAPPAPVPAYKPAPAYPQQRTPIENMQPSAEDQKDIQNDPNSQTRTQGDTIPKMGDQEMRFQQGRMDTTTQQDMMKDDKMRQNIDGITTGSAKENNQQNPGNFKHSALLRSKIEETSGPVMPVAQDMSGNMSDGAHQQPETDMKTSEMDETDKRKNEAAIRLAQMQQMHQMAQTMGTNGPRMIDGNNQKMNMHSW